MHFGPIPEKRELPSYVKKQSAEDLALKTLRQRGILDAEHKKELADAQKQADRLAEKLALLVHKKRFTEKDPFILSLRQLLKNEGILLITHVGEEVTETLEDEADIVEWLPPGEDPADRVADALEPEIQWQGRLLHRAKLSCRQGAEETADAEPAERVPDAESAEDAAASAEERTAADVETEAKAEAAPEADVEAEAAVETVPEPDVEAEAAFEAVSEADVEAKAAVEAVSEPDAEAEAAVEAVSEPDAEAEAAVEAVSEADVEAETDLEAAAAAETETESEALVEAEAAAEAEAAEEAGMETETGEESEAEADVETVAKSLAEAATEADAGGSAADFSAEDTAPFPDDSSDSSLEDFPQEDAASVTDDPPESTSQEYTAPFSGGSESTFTQERPSPYEDRAEKPKGFLARLRSWLSGEP